MFGFQLVQFLIYFNLLNFKRKIIPFCCMKKNISNMQNKIKKLKYTIEQCKLRDLEHLTEFHQYILTGLKRELYKESFRKTPPIEESFQLLSFDVKRIIFLDYFKSMLELNWSDYLHKTKKPTRIDQRIKTFQKFKNVKKFKMVTNCLLSDKFLIKNDILKFFNKNKELHTEWIFLWQKKLSKQKLILMNEYMNMNEYL